ncbi:hypothetical protein D3C78_442100 [compost metagenome]
MAPSLQITLRASRRASPWLSPRRFFTTWRRVRLSVRTRMPLLRSLQRAASSRTMPTSSSSLGNARLKRAAKRWTSAGSLRAWETSTTVGLNGLSAMAISFSRRTTRGLSTRNGCRSQSTYRFGCTSALISRKAASTSRLSSSPCTSPPKPRRCRPSVTDQVNRPSPRLTASPVRVSSTRGSSQDSIATSLTRESSTRPRSWMSFFTQAPCDCRLGRYTLAA